jgi:hypothetical protein
MAKDGDAGGRARCTAAVFTICRRREGRCQGKLPGSWGLPLRGCAPGGTGVTGGRPSAGSGGSPRRSHTQAVISPAGADLAMENARLRRENERLRMEREILKKTRRIFSEAAG